MKPTRLNLGCGHNVMKDYVNLDIVKGPGVIVHNIEKFPYPFDDNTFEEILCNHVLEHINNMNKVINELWRISKNGAKIKILSPHALGPSFFCDPSHKTPLCYRTFDNYNIDNPLIKQERKLTNFGSSARFRIIKRRIKFSEHARIGGIKILGFMDYLINLFPRFYERLFCYILPSEVIYIELEVVK